MTSPAALESLAVSLYESDCRHRSESMARRTILSRIRAHYSFEAWTDLTSRARAAWRQRAQQLLDEQHGQRQEQAAWDRAQA